MYSCIPVPLDGSKKAEAILRHVEELAMRDSATVVLLQVVEPGPYWFGYREAYYVPLEESERRTTQAESYLAALQGILSEKGIKTRMHVLYGPAVEGIIHAAKREGADLIAMASHGRIGLSRLSHGSVAAGVLRRVDRPLLLVRSENEQTSEAVNKETGSPRARAMVVVHRA
jgi:nucleotide-binding universal stress UspA family protein